jgi:hypothetical protein
VSSIIKCGKCLKHFPAYIKPYDYKLEKFTSNKQLVVCPNCKIKNKVDRKIINDEPLKDTLGEKVFDGAVTLFSLPIQILTYGGIALLIYSILMSLGGGY